MECTCLVDRDCCEENWDEACSASHIVSKTAFECVECKRKILPGELHLLEIVKWSDTPRKSRYRTCSDCESLRDHLVCSWEYGSVRDDILYALEDCQEDGIPWAAFAKLTPAAKDYVFGLIERWWVEEGE